MHPALHITRGQVLGVGALALVALGLSLLVPAPAHALELDPPPSVEEVLKAIVDQLFKVKPTDLNGEFLRWLIAVPNFLGDPGNGTLDGDLGGLGQTSTAIAFGVLSAVVTWAVVHYWLAGISFFRGEGTEMLEGITRSVGVALLIIGWPLIFTNAVALSNSISAALVDGPGLDRLGEMLTGAMGSEQLFQEGVAMILGIVITIATIVMVLGLAVTKIVMSVMLAVLFVWMPIAFVIWPVPSLAFITQTSIRLVVSLLAVQVVWAACLATFLAVGQKILDWGTRGSAFDDAVAKPFVALALLSTMMMVTRLLLRLNMGSGGGMGMSGGGMGHMAAPLAGVVSSAAHSQGTGPAGSGSEGARENETGTQRPTEEPPETRVVANSMGGAGAAGGSPSPGTATPASTATQAGGAGAAPAAGGAGAGGTPGTAAASAKTNGAAANSAKAGVSTGATSGAAAGRPGASEQVAGAPGTAEQAAAASKSAQGDDATNQRSARGPDEQPATAAGASSSPVGEQASEGAARSASTSESAAPASVPGEQPGGAGGGGGGGAGADGGAGTSERGGASASGSSAGASPAPGDQPATQPGESRPGAGVAGGAGADGDAADGPPPGGGDAASQPATSSSGSGSDRQSGAAPGGAAGPPADGSAGSASDGGGESALSYDWVAGEFRPSGQSSEDSDQGSDSTPSDDDDIADVPYTGILEAGDRDEGGS